MIVLFTDFGLNGPYIGQMKAVLAQVVPQRPVIDLFANLPVYDPQAAAHLLATYQAEFPVDTIFLCVVDPGVGSEQRLPVILHADGHWYVGPDNGLFDVMAARSECLEGWHIITQPERLSASFHGRDLFAPAAALLAAGEFPEAERVEYPIRDADAADLPRVIYIDHFGNLFTGLRAVSQEPAIGLRYKGKQIVRVKTFSDVPAGEPLCYENSSGLLEIAVNRGRADALFTARIGDPVECLFD